MKYDFLVQKFNTLTRDAITGTMLREGVEGRNTNPAKWIQSLNTTVWGIDTLLMATITEQHTCTQIQCLQS